MPLASATRVGPYEIVSTLGGGSMGEVYVAHDPRLSRNVALKVLASGMPADDNRRRRFVQEARSASALNHPNIVTIHDFGTMDGISYIISELVEGESLRALISRGPLSLRHLLEIGIQIAEGLAAAHAAGIVHRDLKPENIMITPGGRVKILDFGLAKPVLSDDHEDALEVGTFGGDTTTGGRTEPGLILGTVGYMSPEQARGSQVDVQSDQFSLGVMLHEMATGQQPFRRETPMQTLLAIANVEEVPFTPGPTGFRLLVRKCLAKNPAERYASTAEIAERLRRISNELPENIAGAAAPDAREPRWRVPKIHVSRELATRIVAALALLTTGLLLGALLLPRAQAPDLSHYRFTPLAPEGGLQAFPAVSPDGKTVAYSSALGGHFQIFTRAIGSGVSAAITNSSYDCFYPFWSYDGGRVFFISQGSLWAVSAIGGTPEMVYSDVSQAAQSKDTKELVLLRPDSENSASYSLWVSNPQGQLSRLERDPFPAKGIPGPAFIRFSPDGHKLGIWSGSWTGQASLWILPWPAGTARVVSMSTDSGQSRPFSWTPDSNHVVYSDGDHIWTTDVHSGKRRELTTGTGREQAPSLSPDGKALVFSSVEDAPETLRFKLDEAMSAPTPMPGIATASPTRPEYATVEQVDESRQLILHDLVSGWQRALFTEDRGGLANLRFSPDGQRIAFVRQGTGPSQIWIASLGGQTAVRLTQESAFESSPAWSPDGNSIEYITVRNGVFTLAKARIGGNQPSTLLSSVHGNRVAWSPAGDQLAVVGDSPALTVVSSDGSAPRQLGKGAWLSAIWSHDGSKIYAVQNGPKALELDVIDVATGDQQTVRELGIPAEFVAYGKVALQTVIGQPSLAADGNTLYLPTHRFRSRIWMLKGF